MAKDDTGRIVLALTTVAAAVATGLLVFWPRKEKPKLVTEPPEPAPFVPTNVTPVYYADFTAGIFTRHLKVGETLEVAMSPGPTYHVADDFPGEGTIVAGGLGLVRHDAATGYSYAKFIALRPGIAIALITTEGEPGLSMTITITVT